MPAPVRSVRVRSIDCPVDTRRKCAWAHRMAARSTCCLHEAVGIQASGRRVSANLSRLLSGVSEAQRGCRWLATGVAGRQSRSLADRDHASKQGRHPRQGYTNRCDNAPRNIFSLTGFVLKILKSVAPSPTRAIEHCQDDRNRAIRCSQVFTESPWGVDRVPMACRGPIEKATIASHDLSSACARRRRAA